LKTTTAATTATTTTTMEYLIWLYEFKTIATKAKHAHAGERPGTHDQNNAEEGHESNR
jgi:hypothetical protein